MPIVTVQQSPRDLDARRRLVAGITQAFVDAYGIPPEHVQVFIADYDHEHWAKGGTAGSGQVNACRVAQCRRNSSAPSVATASCARSGAAGWAVVFLARQLDLDRHVALKEMAAFHATEPTIARRFVRESRLAGSLTHANVVTVFDYFEHEGTAYIAMEWVERGSLRPYVGAMTPAQIGGVLDGVLAGLGAAEQRSIVHRDLKPENLMVTNDGNVKIADFGIAKATQETRTSAYVTATGTTIGTPAYMAPEQAMARDIGPWTDLYSVGCIAYELFTGAPPFHDAETPMAMMLRHISEPLRPAGEIADVDPRDVDLDRAHDGQGPARAPALGGDRGRGPRGDPARPARPALAARRRGCRSRRRSRREHAPPPSGEWESFEFKPAATGSGESTAIAGIDVEGTGPDTGGELPTALTREAVTPPPPPTRTPADAGARGAAAGHTGGDAPSGRYAGDDAASADTPAPHARRRRRGSRRRAGRRDRADPRRALAARDARPARRRPRRRRARPSRLARAGGLALLATLLLMAIASGMDRWNLFAAFSPLEAIGIAVGTWLVARRPARSPPASWSGSARWPPRARSRS